MDNAEWRQRWDAALAAEDLDPEPGCWWLSFVDTNVAATIPLEEQKPGGDAFLGVAIVEATGFYHAVMRTHELGINPGGEIQVIGPIPPGTYPPEFFDRLLSFDEVKTIPGEDR